MKKEGIYFFLLLCLVSTFASAESIVCEPIDVILVADRSTTMGGAKGVAARDAMNDFVNSVSDPAFSLPNINRIGVVEFGTCSHLTSPLLLLPGNKTLLNNRINAITGGGGGTNLGLGLLQTRQAFLDRPRSAKKFVIVLTDFGSNCFDDQASKDSCLAQGIIPDCSQNDPVLVANALKSSLDVDLYGIGYSMDLHSALNRPLYESQARSIVSNPSNEYLYFVNSDQLDQLPSVYMDIKDKIGCTCGDGIVQTQIGEECDSTNLNGKTCKSFAGYVGGTLKCSGTCTYDVGSCTQAIAPTITASVIMDPASGPDNDGALTFRATATGSVSGEFMGNINSWKVEIFPPTGLAYNLSIIDNDASPDKLSGILSGFNNGAYNFRIWGNNTYGKEGVSATGAFSIDIPIERKWLSTSNSPISSASVGNIVRMQVTNIQTAGSYGFYVFSGSDNTVITSYTFTKSGSSKQDFTRDWTITYAQYKAMQDPEKVYFNVSSGSSGYLKVILPPSQTNWTNSGGTRITQTDLGVKVYLTRTNSGLPIGPATATIYEKDNFVYQYIRSVTGTVDNNGRFRAEWTPIMSELSGLSNFNNFVFNVTSGEYSEDLKIIVPANFTWRNWSDENQVITEANVGENVSLYIQYTGLPAGPASVEVWDDDGADDKIRTSDVRGVITGVVDTLGTFRGEMKIDETDWNAGNDGDDADNGLEFYFKVVGGSPVDPKGMTILRVSNPFTAEKETYWSDLLGNKITNAYVGQKVRMVLNNSGLVSETINFRISEKDDGMMNDDDIKTISSTSNPEGLFVVEWSITQEDFDKCWESDSGNELADGTTNFYFKADGFSDLDSGELNISIDSVDDPFTIEIMNPPCGSDFDITEAFDLKINTTDEDDEVTGKVMISNASGEIFSQDLVEGVLTIPSTSFVTYAGTYKVVANGTNSDGLKARAIINLIIINPSVDGKYVAACIDEPKDFSLLSSNYGIIKFNASSTRGVNNVAGVKTEIAKSEMLFNWIFSDEDRDNPYKDGAVKTSQEFFKVYIPVKDNWGDLEVVLK